MGCAESSEVSKEDKALHRQAEAEMKKDRVIQAQEAKLLLLGAGESGKSTFAKQLKILHLDGFSEREKKSFISHIRSNILEALRALVKAHKNFDLKYADEKTEEVAAKYEKISITNFSFTAETRDDCKLVWEDPSIKECYKRRAEYQLPDSAVYFFNRVDEIAGEDYVPNIADILRCRARTTGIREMRIKIDKSFLKIIDVGGQRSERRKWIHAFADATALIFLIAMSEYDMKLYEAEEVNRMDEAIDLFKDTTQSKWFASMPIILFLNKKDLFEEKIKKVPLNSYEKFAEYEGGDDAAAGTEFLKAYFKGLCSEDQSVYIHDTCATDTENIDKVFDSVKGIFLDNIIDF